MVPLLPGGQVMAECDMVTAALALLHGQGRAIEALHYHAKAHPKSGEVAHLFRGKEKGRAHTKAAQPKRSTQPSNTVRFVGTVDEHGALVGLREVGSSERKRIGRRNAGKHGVTGHHDTPTRVCRGVEGLGQTTLT